MIFFSSDSSSHFVTAQNIFLSLSFNKYGFNFKVILERKSSLLMTPLTVEQI